MDKELISLRSEQLKLRLEGTSESLVIGRILSEMQHAHRLTTLALLRSLDDDKAGMYEEIEKAVSTLYESAKSIEAFSDRLRKRIDDIGSDLDKVAADASK